MVDWFVLFERLVELELAHSVNNEEIEVTRVYDSTDDFAEAQLLEESIRVEHKGFRSGLDVALQLAKQVN